MVCFWYFCSQKFEQKKIGVYRKLFEKSYRVVYIKFKNVIFNVLRNEQRNNYIKGEVFEIRIEGIEFYEEIYL